MPKQGKTKNHHQRGKLQRLATAAPGLFKERVTLTDAYQVNGSSIQGDGVQQFYLSANGYSTRDANGTFRVPQPGIWNQYAAMYDFYQVEKVSVKFMPYKYELTASTTGVNNLRAVPTFSCIDPESTGPTTVSGLASYGNLKSSAAYATHSRELNFHALGIQKQSELILATNGINNSRAQYTTPAQIVIWAQCPNLQAQPMALAIFTVHYVFSGRRAPAVDLTLNQITETSENEADGDETSNPSEPQATTDAQRAARMLASFIRKNE